MSLVITTNAESDRVDRQEQSIYSAYSYRNDIGSAYKIPANSQVCLQSAKVNLDGRLTVSGGNSIYYDYFGKELSQEDGGTPKLKDTTTHPILQNYSQTNQILELTHEELAAQIEKEHKEYHPNNKGKFNCAAKRNAGLDFEGYSFEYDQNITAPTTNKPTDSQDWYNDEANTRFTYNTGTGVFTRDDYAQDDYDPAVAILLGRPLSLTGKVCKVDISNANASNVTWAVGLSRDVPETTDNFYVPPYYDQRLDYSFEEDIEDQGFFTDYCVHRDANGLLRLTHSVPTTIGENTYFVRQEVQYWLNASSDFTTGAPYNISTNGYGITAVEFETVGEEMRVKLIEDKTKYTLTRFNSTQPKNTYCKPITQTCWCLHPVLFVGADATNKTNSLTVEEYCGLDITDYDSKVLYKGGWFEAASVSGDGNWMNQCEEVDTRNILDPILTSILYTPIGLNASDGVSYKTTMIVAPSDTYEVSNANTAQVFGFPDRAVVNEGVVLFNKITFNSDTAANTDSVKSIFIRLNGFGQQVLNALTKNKSTILAHLPTADSQYSDGGRIFYEPNRDVWLDLNNPYEITTSDFSIDLTYSNEQYAKVCQGQTIVVLYFRERPDATA
jgi:hypothetical protein